LKRPSNLNFYLQYIQNHPQEYFKSHIELYEHIWNNSLGEKKQRKKRVSLLIAIASEMTEDAKQALPLFKYDENIEDIDYLCSVGILTKSFDRKQISFAHQTLQAFAWTRSIINKGTLTEFVFSHQNNLNIRPKLSTALVYLREADPEEYKNQIQSLLLDSLKKLRKHILYLLIETIGISLAPRDEEVLIISRLLDRKDLFLKVCQSIARQPDWFDTLKNSHIEFWMQGNEIQKRGALIILSSLISEKREDIFPLLDKYWKNERDVNNLFYVLRENDKWNDTTLQLASFLMKQDDVNNYIAHDITSLISYTNPDLAPPIMAEYFNCQFEKLEKQPYVEPQIEEGTDEGMQQWLINRAKHEPFENLANLNHAWHNIEAIAKAAPKAFIESFWPFLEKLTIKLKSEYMPIQERYISITGSVFSDDNLQERTYLRKAFEEAIKLYAIQYSENFIEFVNQKKSSLFSLHHRLVVIGLKQLVEEYPNYVLDYLLEDDRRLFLGDDIRDSKRSSLELIQALFPCLIPSLKDTLENKILSLETYKAIKETDIETRRNYLRWNRGVQLEFLSVLPEESMSPNARRIIKENERRRGKKTENPLTKKRRSSFMMAAKSPMSLNQMELASVDHIVKCFREFKEDHHGSFEYISSSEHAKTLGELCKKDPKKAVAVAENLPLGNSKAVESVIQELPLNEVNLIELQNIILHFCAKGFNTDDFYQACAKAIYRRIERPKGLSDKWCETVEAWMNHSGNRKPIAHSIENKSEKRRESLIWQGDSYILPQGNYTFIEVISYGLLFREQPEYKRWLDFLAKCLNDNDVVEFWEFALVFLIRKFLPFCQKNEANDFLIKLHQTYPQITGRRDFGIVIAGAVHWLDDDSLNEWMEKIYLTSSETSHQLFGEILGFRLVRGCNDTWCQRQYRELQKTVNTEALIGLSYSLRQLWEYHEFRPNCSKYFTELLEFKNDEIDEILMRIFHQEKNVDLSPEFKSVLDAFIDNRTFERSKTRFISRTLASLTAHLPDKIYQVSQQIIKGAGQELGDLSTSIAADAPELVTIAITLHNLGTVYQKRGLDLFEQLLEANAYKAMDALYEVDSRPLFQEQKRLPRR